ncbi:hypothetical protein GCWU000325_00267 [Alloprevotella tannerae ATCC 51259]|uniref:Uncharacterized protein n=1 Tax=Alloprevotella tannerae ATCC 51259 TaxID=626522 RepID=C9LDJ6_9BACT|nr:hypothetical protein GCWU000325_00267 [Alloprevotella tannerae ATCC 51259]
MECQKENLNRIVSAIEAVFPTLFDVYRTAIILLSEYLRLIFCYSAF